MLNATSVFPINMPYLKGTGDVSLTYHSKNKRLGIDIVANYGKDRNQIFTGTLLSTLAPPNAPGPKDENGKLVWQENGAGLDNPLADLYKKYTIKTGNLLSSMKLGYRIVDSLNFILSAGVNIETTKIHRFHQLPKIQVQIQHLMVRPNSAHRRLKVIS